MIPVHQTLFGSKEGNCFQACLASIFELPLDQVPHVMLEEDWPKALDEWLAQFDLYAVQAEVAQCRTQNWTPEGYHLVGGKSKGGNGVYHSVVGYRGKIVFDPHPMKPGLEEEETWRIFVKKFETKKEDQDAE